MPNPIYDDSDSELQRLNGGLTRLPDPDSTTSNVEQDELKRLQSTPVDTTGKKTNETDGKNTEKEDTNSDTDSTNPKWFTPSGAKKKTKGWLTKKKAAAIAGITASVVGISATVLVPLMGPLEFIHLAESIRIPHFGAQEDAGDIRMNALLRYARKGHAGETRIASWESKYLTRIQTDMAKSGFKAEFNPIVDTYKGLVVDTTADKSPYKGMTPEQVKTELTRKFGTDAFELRADGKWQLNESKSGFSRQYKTLRIISKEMGYNGLTSAMRMRVLAKYGVVTFNPLRVIDKKVGESLAKTYTTWKEERDARIKNGNKTTLSTAGLKDSDEKDATKPVEGAGSTDGEVDKGKIGAFFENAKVKNTVAGVGGLGVLAGVVCLAKASYDQAGEVKNIQLVEPLMRIGTEAVSVGSQVPFGENFNETSLEMQHTLLNSRDEKGNITSSWDQAASIRANNGGSGGVALDPTVSEALLNTKIPFLEWTQNSAVSGLCGPAGAVVTTGVSLALTVVSGGFASAAVGFIAGPYLTDAVIDKTSAFLAGEALDLDATGAQYGAQADLGAKLGADLAAMQFGGEAMSTADTMALNQEVVDAENEDFAKLPLKDRLFDATKRKSLAGKFVNAYPKSGNEAMNNIASLFTGTFANLFHGFSSVSPSASAQSLQYNYGLPKFGFTLAELSDEKYADPYQNSDAAEKLFNSSQGESYIKRALDCYGVSITKGVEGWGANAAQNAYKTYYAKGERDAKCTDRSDTNWMRTRYFIFDTATMDSYACLQGDSNACAYSGFGSQEAAAGDTGAIGSLGTIPTGTSKELAQKIWDSPNITFQTPQKKRYFKDVVETGGQDGCGSFTPISPKLLGTILALSQKYKLVLGVFVDGHGCNSGDHPKGQAIDLNGVNPLSGGGGTGNTLSYRDFTLPIVKDLYLDIAKTLSENGGGKINQYQCFGDYGATPPNVGNISGVYTGYLDDECSHLHMAVKR